MKADERNSGRYTQWMKNTFVQNDEKQPEYRENFVRTHLRTSDDTPGIVCIELLNDTPGCVELGKGKRG